MMCRYCGSPLPDGALFCGECGRAVHLTEDRVPVTASSAVIVPVARSVRGLGTIAVVAPVLEPAADDDFGDDDLNDDDLNDDDWDDIDAPGATGFSIADLAFSSPGDTTSPDHDDAMDVPDGTAVETAQHVARCPQCDEPMADGDVFCGECGFVLRTVSPPSGEEQTRTTNSFDPEEASSSIVLLPDLIQLGSTGGGEVPVDEAALDEASLDEARDIERADADVTTEIEPLPAEDDAAEDGAADNLVGQPEAEPELPADPEDVDAPERPVVRDEQLIDELHREPVASIIEARAEADPDLEFDEPLPFALLTSKPTPVTRARPIPDPFPWGTDNSALGEDIEKTRMVADAPSGTRFVLQFSTGESVTVLGSGLVGRNPSMQPGEYVDQLVPIFDAGKSVSKTHLEFGQEAGRFWVSDRYSTNGSVIRQPDTEPRRCDPGRRYFVARGTRVDVGEQFLVVS